MEEQIKTAIKKNETKFEGDEKLLEFQKQSFLFEDLVQKGFVKKRGYNLLSIKDTYSRKYIFNIKKV